MRFIPNKHRVKSVSLLKNALMIDYIIGKAAETAPAEVILDNNGIGYEVAISLLDYSKIKVNEPVKLFVHEVIREDAHILYGFLSKESREMFRLLIGVSGVGPNTARLILSSLTVEQLEETIASGNDSMLKAVKGIGGKTAQRIIVDLKDKIKAVEKSLVTTGLLSTEESFNDAQSALVMLGFSHVQSQKALRKIFAGQPGLSAEEAIKLALKML